MSYWVLKAKPSRTNLETALRRGAEMQWRTKRPPKRWKAGDGVVLWQASPVLAVRGIGTITDIARPDETGETRLRVRSPLAAFDGPTIAQLRALPALSGASFLKAGAAGTVFPLTSDEATALVSSLEPAARVDVLRSWRSDVDASDSPEIAISIRQPYAEMILRGTKTAEFRGTATKRRGRVFVYAARRPGLDEYWDRIGLRPGDLPIGLIVGTIDIMTCVPHPVHGFAYELSNPQRLSSPRRPVGHPQPRWFRPFP